MNLLNEEQKPWTPPKPKKYKSTVSQEERDTELNNFDREELSEDFSTDRK